MAAIFPTKGMAGARTHKPLFPVSCNLLTATAIDGSKVARKYKAIKITGIDTRLELLNIEDNKIVNSPRQIIMSQCIKVKYQNSARLARPLVPSIIRQNE